MGFLAVSRSAQLERILKRMEAIPKEVREQVKPALAASGQELARTMRMLAPEDEGDLKRSIAVTMPGDTTPAYSQPGGSRMAGPLEVLVTAGNQDARHSHLLEYGTTKMPAKPYFWASYRLLKRRMRRRIARAIAKAVKDGASK